MNRKRIVLVLLLSLPVIALSGDDWLTNVAGKINWESRKRLVNHKKSQPMFFVQVSL